LRMVSAEFLTSLGADRGLVGNLSSQPNTKFENPLKLYVTKAPPIAVTQRMCRQVVVQRVRATVSIGEHMVRVPIVASRAPPQM
jgi:hypothetical protein